MSGRLFNIFNVLYVLIKEFPSFVFLDQKQSAIKAVILSCFRQTKLTFSRQYRMIIKNSPSQKLSYFFVIFFSIKQDVFLSRSTLVRINYPIKKW